MTNNESKYYRAVGTDSRIIMTSKIGQDYYEFMKEVREELKYSESHIGVAKVEEVEIPSQR